MPLFENMQLQDKHTFHMEASARYWADFESVEELRKLLQDNRFKDMPKFPVGGGSNLLFTKDYPGMLLHSTIQSIEPTENSDDVQIRVGSGVVWDDLVAYAVERGWSGWKTFRAFPVM